MIKPQLIDFKFWKQRTCSFVCANYRKDLLNNREEYFAFIKIMGPFATVLWPLFAYFWSNVFGIFENFALRWFIASIYLLLTIGVYTSKRVTRNLHVMWVLLMAGSLGIFPWYMYLSTDRSTVWLLSLIFFSLTMFLAVRGLDAFLCLLASAGVTFAMFHNVLTKSDAVIFTVQMAVAFLTWPMTFAFRVQRLKLLEKSRDLEVANDLLRNQEKSKDEFVAKVAHELRNPLSIVTSVVWDITDDEETPKPVKRKLKLMQYAIERADRMVCELLDLQRFVLGVATLNKDTHCVDEYANHIAKSMRYVASAKGVTFVVNAVPGMQAVFDKVRMNHIVYNLIDNAFKFVPKNTGAVFVDFYNKGNDLCVRVRDNGRGISEDNLKLIFVRYYQDEKERRNTRGAGIGLSLVKEVSEAHGGNVTVRSIVGKGTQFDVVLPNCVLKT